MRDTKVAAAIAAVLSGEVKARNPEKAVAVILLRLKVKGLHDDPETAAHVTNRIALLTASETPIVHLAIWDLFRSAKGRVGRSQVAEEFLLKGWYAINAVKRVIAAEDRADALEKERRYHADHLDASKRRIAIAKDVDRFEEENGKKAGWHGILDERTDPECKVLIGKNFLVTRKPKPGWPGTVHRFCRCSVGLPFPDGEMIA